MVDTIHYIVRDLKNALSYLPYGLIPGIPTAIIVVWLYNFICKKRNKTQIKFIPAVLFGIYLAVLLMITFWSREAGSVRKIDLKLFSTWGINHRNNAFFIENILLFLPYGFLCRWNFKKAHHFFYCILLGFATSFCIELMQLITQRGFFQIDDILTNTLGTFLGDVSFVTRSAHCHGDTKDTKRG